MPSWFKWALGGLVGVLTLRWFWSPHVVGADATYAGSLPKVVYQSLKVGDTVDVVVVPAGESLNSKEDLKIKSSTVSVVIEAFGDLKEGPYEYKTAQARVALVRYASEVKPPKVGDGVLIMSIV